MVRGCKRHAGGALGKGRTTRCAGEERTNAAYPRRVEPLQAPAGPEEGRITDPALATLVRELCASNSGLCIATSRQHIADIAQYSQSTAVFLDLDELPDAAGAELLRVLGVNGEENELIPSLSDQNRWAQSRKPMDMIVQG